MTEDEAYKVHIQYTFNAFCKIVIRHAAIDIILKLRRRWEREVSLDYLMNEKFVQLAEPEQLEEYLFTACGQTAVLYHAELAAALARLPEQTQEKIFRYYFLRQPQRVIGACIGRSRSTAGRHIQLALQRLREGYGGSWRKIAMSKLLPYETIVKAHEGDPDAIDTVLSHYAGYIRYFSKVHGQVNAEVEEYVKQQLIAALFKFRFDR